MALLIGFGLAIGVFYGLVAAGQRGGATFFSNPWLAVSILTAGVCAIAGGVVAAAAILRQRERSLLVFAALLVGAFVLLFSLGELLGPH